jgi:acetate kinase
VAVLSAVKTILVLNFGSTSVKISLFECDNLAKVDEPIWKTSLGATDDSAMAIKSLWSGKQPILKSPEQIVAVGHRVVHGGSDHAGAIIVNEQVMKELEDLSELAPLHQGANIRGIKIAAQLLPNAVQVATFDTAYFHDMPEQSKVYALPYEWYADRGMRRFGFHGISHEYCAQKAAEMLGRVPSDFRVITCHLGGGSSITATLNGKAVATTMGFTPLEGVVMGTRCGSIDPGIVLHVLEHNICSLTELTDILNHQSGLKGVSGISGDMQELQKAAASGSERAQLAMDIYSQSVAANICGLLPALRGTDAIAFTGGIGENSTSLRESVAERLDFLSPKIPYLVVQAKEDLSTARQTFALCSQMSHN